MSRTTSIHEEFARVAASYPDRVAVVDDGTSLTYSELDRRANRIAHTLRLAGVSRGKVGLSINRSVEVVVGVLAILKSGAAYVPLDGTYPPSRLEFMVADAALDAILVSDDQILSGIDHGAVPIVHMREADDPSPPPVDVRESDLAYVIYTSGSTGTPKGVMVEHRQVLSLFDAVHEHFDFGPDDVWTVIHSYAFDFSVWEIFGALLHGGRAVVVPDAVAKTPEDLWRLVQRERVTVLNTTPTYFARLDEADRGYGGDLRYVVFGGEALEFDRLRGWYGRYGENGPQLVNMYGITETTVHVTIRPLERDDVSQSGSLIGRPLPHLWVRLLDETCRPVPRGEVGEICVGGAGVARGYLGREELTAQRFIDDPVDPSAGRLYRSGDLGRVLPSGELEYLGRSDSQVKVRGYRIELGEVQAHLREHPGVTDVAVAVRGGQRTGRQLVAYLVSDGAVPAAEDLRAHLERRLPAYMIPALFVPLAELPLTANGKLDHAALPDPGTAGPVTPDIGRSGTHDPGARASELLDSDSQTLTTRLLAIWRDVLEIDTLGAEDSFHAVGGDSIQAIRLVGAAREHGITFTVEQLLEQRTVAALARLLAGPTSGDRKVAPVMPESAANDSLSPEDLAALPAGVVEAYPMTSLQLGMLFHSEGADHETYHSVSTVVVHAPFDEARLRRGIEGVMNRHEALRSTFDLENFTVPMQLVHDRVAPALVVADLTAMSIRDRAQALQDRLARERSTPVDWTKAPLIRFCVDVLGPDSFQFTWTEHHALLDGWSSNSVFAELISDYLGREHATPSGRSLPPLRDHTARESRALASPDSREFWRTLLDGVPATRIAAADGEADRTFRIGSLTLPPGAHGRLTATARACETTPRNLLAAAYALALGRHLDRGELVIGIVLHSRAETPGGDALLGLFLNTVPVPVRLDGSIGDIAATIGRLERKIHRHRHYPLAAIQKAAGPGFELDNMINFTDFHQLDPLARDGVIGKQGVINHVRTQFPLVVEAERVPGSDDLMVSVQFRSEYWKPADAERLLQCLRGTFTAVTADPADAMSEVAVPLPQAPVTDVTRPQNASGTTTATEPPPVSAARAATTPLAGDWDLFVADHWRTVLGVSPQTRETTFSDLGGTSLTVMRLLGRYTQRGFPVKVVDLLEHDTVAAQADLLATRGNGGR